MDPSSAETNPELESFREQWRAEVRARHPTTAGGPAAARPLSSSGPSATAGSTAGAGPHDHHHHHFIAEHPRRPPAPTKKPAVPLNQDEDYVQPVSFDETAEEGTVAGGIEHGGVGVIGETTVSSSKEPVSALEHYEKAVEREAAGSLGDSLRLYRKAFRMDDAVDQKYKNKHFPKVATSKPTKKATTSSATAAGGPTAKEGAAAAASAAEQPKSMKELIQSFAGLSIEPAGPPIEGMPPPLCPISTLPDEILVHILRDVAIADVGDFVRLAQVCKRLAFLVATEDRIWRRICLGSEFGFGGMHYHWQRQITWEPLGEEDLLREATEEEEQAATAAAEAIEQSEDGAESPPLIPLTIPERTAKHTAESTATTHAFFKSLYSSSWQRMFRVRPRIRFNGCYISTVNYIRSGYQSNQYTWNSPVHIVTYYRYLRFFRDGTCLSLLTTAEPANVVHHLTRDTVALHQGGAQPHLPSAVVQSTLRGRWRLARAADNPDASLSEVEGDLMVETQGVGKYIYRLDLSMRSAAGGKAAGGATRNNKLVWRGFYSYDRLTDDWAEFTLKNDKPFFFSRVRSYGVMGE